jgi:hypothetical protein
VAADKFSRAQVVLLLTLIISCWAPETPALAASRVASQALKGTYGFSVVGTALLTTQSSGVPTLVPAAISGSLVFASNGTFSGEANVDVGGMACNAEGPGPIATALSGTYVMYATAPYAVGTLAIVTSVLGMTPPGEPTPCVNLDFNGPVTGTASGASGIVFAADPDSRFLDITILYGSGSVGQQPVSDLTAQGRAVRVIPFGGFPGGTEP